MLCIIYLNSSYVTVYTNFTEDTLTISAYAEARYNITYITTTFRGDTLSSTADFIVYLKKHAANLDDSPVYTVILPNNEILQGIKQIIILHAPSISKLMEKQHIRIKLHYTHNGKMHYTTHSCS
jgi:hypothetical protein